MKIIVNPDIHGRTFWEKSVPMVEECEKVIFLGDYLDPYDFEHISVEKTIQNFEKIIDFKKHYTDKVVLLIGNHDLPYMSKTYYKQSFYHCRHSKKHHNQIHDIFNENIELFKIACIEENILFTHAGIDSKWLKNVVECDDENINNICKILNDLINTEEGIKKLFKISSRRGGYNLYPSCVWADVYDIMEDNETENKPFNSIKQVFGHTLQAFYDTKRNIVFGQPIEFGNCKMLDCAKQFILNTDNFTIKET